MPSPPIPRKARVRRARRPSASERREEILRQAVRCFAARGFSGTTTRRIAECVGITEAALYRYYPSKEALYSAIIDQKLGSPSVIDHVRGVADRRDDVAVFRGIASAILEAGRDDPEFIRLMFFSSLESHDLSTRLFESRVEPFRAFVTQYVRTRIGEGAFRSIDPMLGARAFIGMLWDYLNVRVVHGQSDVYPQPLHEVVDTFVDLFLTGIRETGASRTAKAGGR